jgi:protein gp37
MGQKTKITWTDHTFNPWWGCTKVSLGCDHCYAERLAVRYGFQIWGTEAPRRFMSEKQWLEPLKWNDKAEAEGHRRRVFCGSMCDVFENPSSAILDTARERLWQLIDQTPSLDWLLLTKRPENMIRIAPRDWLDGWPDHVWALATVENQEVLPNRLDALLKVPAKVRGVSIEPMLGPIDLGLRNWAHIPSHDCRLDWVIVGCESGPRRRLCALDDVRFVVEDCRLGFVKVFVKQLEINGRVEADQRRWPEDMRIQEFPVSW